MAAEVTMYGVVDTGLLYQHGEASASIDGIGSASAEVDSFSMEPGTNSASRFGICGTEDLGNGMTVGVKLENGFESGTGALKTDSKLFDRESTLFIKGGFGTVYAGRMGTLVSDAGSVGFYGSMASALATGWSDNIAGHNAVMANYSSRHDNMIAHCLRRNSPAHDRRPAPRGRDTNGQFPTTATPLSVLNERPAPSTAASSTGRRPGDSPSPTSNGAKFPSTMNLRMPGRSTSLVPMTSAS